MGKAQGKRIQERERAAGEPKRSVRYLRVSTVGQVNTDYNPEGISLPAQREAAIRKEQELGAVNVDEYLEPGRSGTTIDKRPSFQEMIARIRREQDVDYIIVYHFNRIFRNSIDAAITKRELARYGVRVVSTVLDMGESPEGAMVEAIIHAVDQYQSEANGADIRYKMGQKAKNGGTLALAPIGYSNVREQFEGREVRTVAVDEERAPLVVRAFELYSTGRYSAQEVLAIVTAAGLRTRGTKSSPPKPISIGYFHRILQDRYYLGRVEYNGEEYEGRHPALISPELFERVQQIVALRGGGGTRERTHSHFLKGQIWCGRCGRRFVITPGRGNGGTYFYFLCRGRQDRKCDQPYLRVEKVEAAVASHYATVRLSDDFQSRVRDTLDEVLLDDLEGLNTLKKRLGLRLAELSTKEDGFLELVGTPGWPKDKIRRKLDAIQAEREGIQAQLEDTTKQLERGREFFLTALALLRDPQACYKQCGTSVQRAMNKVIFTKLFIDGDQVVHHELTNTVSDLLEAHWLFQERQQLTEARNDKSPVQVDEAALSNFTGADLLDLSLAGHGSSRSALVGDTGIEPVTSSV